MCSKIDPQLALIGTAIDELAEAARQDAAAGGADAMAERLAGIWAMVADLDPGLAQRVSRYTATD
jgi:hypothetical protein